MLFKRNIDKEVLDEFVSSFDGSHYMQLSKYAIFRAKGNIYYTGMYDNESLVGTAILIEEKNRIGKSLYVPAGMCLDYHNKELVKAYTEAIVAYGKELKANQLFIDPPVLRKERHIDGREVENGENNEDVTAYLESLGFKHRGYNYAYDGSHRNRYTLMLDIDRSFDEVTKGFPKSKLTRCKRLEKMPMKFSEKGSEVAPVFAKLANELANIKQFDSHDSAYFKRLIETYQDNGHTYLVTLDLGELYHVLQEEIASGKYKKDPEAKKHAEDELLRVEKERQSYGDIVDLCVAFFVTNHDTSYNLFTYVNKELQAYSASDFMHYHVIQEMQKMGIKKYDFVGFSGIVDESDPYYSLYAYKKSFGSTFIEHIGEFTYVLNKHNVFINRLITKMGRIIKK